MEMDGSMTRNTLFGYFSWLQVTRKYTALFLSHTDSCKRNVRNVRICKMMIAHICCREGRRT